MMILHWWHVAVGFALVWNAGFLFGLSWKMDHAYQRGRRAMADEMEFASGMRDALCTCARDPEHCPYHRIITTGPHEQKIGPN